MNPFREVYLQELKKQKTADRYHINHPDRPATLASYKDKESAIKDRDAKYPGAKVHQVGPRGKVKATFEEVEHIDELKDSTLQSYQAKRGNPEARKKTALAAMSDFFGARTGKAGAAHEKHGQGLERAHQKLEKSRIRQTAMNPQKPHNPPPRKTGFRSGAEDDTYGT